MLKGFASLLIFQCAGIFLSTLLHLPVPGAVLGMMLLLIYVLVFTPSKELEDTSTRLLAFLPLFILPASAGILDYGPLLKSAWFPLSLALLGSLVVSFILIPFIFRFFLRLFGVRQ